MWYINNNHSSIPCNDFIGSQNFVLQIVWKHVIQQAMIIDVILHLSYCFLSQSKAALFKLSNIGYWNEDSAVLRCVFCCRAYLASWARVGVLKILSLFLFIVYSVITEASDLCFSVSTTVTSVFNWWYNAGLFVYFQIRS